MIKRRIEKTPGGLWRWNCYWPCATHGYAWTWDRALSGLEGHVKRMCGGNDET